MPGSSPGRPVPDSPAWKGDGSKGNLSAKAGSRSVSQVARGSNRAKNGRPTSDGSRACSSRADLAFARVQAEQAGDSHRDITEKTREQIGATGERRARHFRRSDRER